ncbi:MAG: hypothetical protein NVS3B19_05160 [Ginsengibacter sp.]
MRRGDYLNASITLEKALKADPENLEIGKDLAVNYLVLKKNNKALEIILPFIEKGAADDQAYQIAGNIYNALDQRKESENIYRKGIKKYPSTGALYNEYGIMLLSRQDMNAIKIWEKGIENDPQFAGNYYNAAKYYNLNSNYLWASIYSEVFLLLESGTSRSPEMKNILFENYKKLVTDDDVLNNLKGKNLFEKTYLQTIAREKPVLSIGINTETLTMFRTRFILDWNSLSKKMPFNLFDIQTQLLQEGMFDSYDESLFGVVQNLAAYQNWINVHADEYASFSNFMKDRIFKFSKGQYYH